MGGFSKIVGEETIMNADNACFDGTARGETLQDNGDMWIGSTAPNAGGTHINVGTLTSTGGTIAISYNSPNINLESAGGSAIETLTPDEDFDGSAATPISGASNNINVLGSNPSGVTVTETYNSTGLATGNLDVEHRAWISQYVVDPSTTPGTRGTFSTIVAALAQAVTDGTSEGGNTATILVRRGTYSGNITIANTSSFAIVAEGIDAANPNFAVYQVIISGDITNAGNLELTNIYCTSGTITNTNVIGMEFCKLDGAYTATAATISLSNCYVGASFTDDVNSSTNLFYCPYNTGSFTIVGQMKALACGFLTVTLDDTGFAYIDSCKNCTLTSASATTVFYLQNSTLELPINTIGEVQYSNIAFDSLFSTGAFFTGPPASIKLLQCSQGNTLNRTATATDYAATIYNYLIGVTDTSSAWQVTLPAASACSIGQAFVVKDESLAAATNNITVAASAGNIDGAASVLINTNGGSITVYSDGSNYFVM